MIKSIGPMKNVIKFKFSILFDIFSPLLTILAIAKHNLSIVLIKIN